MEKKIDQLSREKISTEIVEAIDRCQTASGREVRPILGRECPLCSIPCFDSLCAVEVTAELESRLQIKLEENIFVKTTKGKVNARTLDEVCDRLLSAARKGGA